MDTINHLVSCTVCLIIVTMLAVFHSSQAQDMATQFFTTPDDPLAHIIDNGQEIQIGLDQANASGFQSYQTYLFGSFNMKIKLVPNDSAGTVTSYYMTSLGAKHDELDFEFLGNSSGNPYVLQTNVFSNGQGGREQRILLWFDPRTDFHNYSLLWNEELIVFMVDNTTIRVFPNIENTTDVPYLHNQSMNVYASIWDGDSWATEGGRIKINWTNAPFVASYREFTADACHNTSTDPDATICASTKWWNQPNYQVLNSDQLNQLKMVQTQFMIYNYCTDTARYNLTPPECSFPFGDRQTPTPIFAAAPRSSLDPVPVSHSISPSLLPINSQGSSFTTKTHRVFIFPAIIYILALFL